MADAKLAEKIHIVSPELLAMPVSELGLAVRPTNCLVNDGIKTVGELLQATERELLRIPNFGRLSLKEVNDGLADLGLAFPADDGTAPLAVPQYQIIKQTITRTFWFCPSNHAHETEDAANECTVRLALKNRHKALAEAEAQAVAEARKLAIEKRQREREEFKKRFAESEISKSGLDVRLAEALCDVGVVDRASFREKFVKDNAFDLAKLQRVPTLWVQDYPAILRWLNSPDDIAR